MTTENALKHALVRDIDRVGDGSAVQIATIIESGRRRRRNRNVRRGAGALATLAMTAGGALAFGATGPAAAATWSLTPAPDQVNARIVELVKQELPAGTTIASMELTAYEQPPAGQGSPEAGGIPLPRPAWDRADAWRAVVDLGSGRSINVFLGHAQGEVEGDAAASCRADVAAGNDEVCDPGTVQSQGQDVDVVWSEGTAERMSDGTLWGPNAQDGEHDGTPVTTRSLESHPGGDFLVAITEESPAGQAPLLDRHAMAGIALDRALLAAG